MSNWTKNFWKIWRNLFRLLRTTIPTRALHVQLWKSTHWNKNSLLMISSIKSRKMVGNFLVDFADTITFTNCLDRWQAIKEIYDSGMIEKPESMYSGYSNLRHFILYYKQGNHPEKSYLDVKRELSTLLYCVFDHSRLVVLSNHCIVLSRSYQLEKQWNKLLCTGTAKSSHFYPICQRVAEKNR